VKHLTAECAGLAGLFRLDEKAAAILRADWSPTHDVEPGAIRVFLPGADPASGDDARRHRVLPASTILAEDPGLLSRYLGTACRKRATELPLPAHVAAVDRILEQAEQAALREAVARREAEQAAAVPVSGKAEAPRAPDADAGIEMSSVVAGLRDQIDELTESLRQARESLEGEQLENAVMHEELLAAKAAAERLRARLPAAARLGNGSGNGNNGSGNGYGNDGKVLPQYPRSFAELLAWMHDRGLPRVVFTGKPDEALALDDHNPLGAWASKTWEILRVLDGYAELRSTDKFGQGVHAYLERTPAGRPGYSVHAHATQESDLVSKTPKYRNHRMRPVPSEVSPDGMIYMPAHFKITQHGLISPRLYYYDDATGTGKIYVGYIGKHLPNFHTN
jgi:hypothetical protein